MAEQNYVPASSVQYCTARIMSPEIVELGEDSKSYNNSRDRSFNDVYVAVGKDDLEILKWALHHAVTPGARVFLIHVFPPLASIPTPVGRISSSQLSKEQIRGYLNEESNKRRSLLQKYIRLCNDSKVTVDTMLIESKDTAQAILDLIPVLNITSLVMGTKRPSHARVLRKRAGKGKFVEKKAPDYCEVSIVHDGKKVLDDPVTKKSRWQRSDFIGRFSEQKMLACACFPGNSGSYFLSNMYIHIHSLHKTKERKLTIMRFFHLIQVVGLSPGRNS
ncbi:hypothetical protein K2173_028599 [Erythroxylum novogranatense]|uniref:UspA domain-containing protein n=1 Tax=Erythroxylum novogranatense TaxID=1862640 RepID=A0AAV8U2A2_9ROSI|nr:hypothetical protein K2173_028599 [Erythroxylum novogranatense]